jgi:cytochrome c-type biogenesis protein
MQYLILFFEGIITFISPCLLPLLPIYISYFAAGKQDKRRTLVNALGFVCGFTLVFVILGAFAGTAGRLLADYAVAVNIVTGLVVIILGLNYLGVINILFINRGGGTSFGVIAKTGNLHFFSSMLFGMAFSISWMPCVSAFLGSALMLASSRGDTLTGITMLFVYSLGLGIPFMVSALLIDQLKAAFDGIKNHYKVINIVCGILLVLLGIMMATGLMGHFLALFTF